MTEELDLLTDPLRPAPDVVARCVAGEYLLVPVRAGVARMDFIFTANEIGSAIFGLLDGARDGRDIARRLSEEFEVDEDRAIGDVVEFLRALCEAGLAKPARGRGDR